MDIGHCPECARPYTAGEVVGLGILRSRPAERGGPLVEFSCPGCDRLIHLLPHGEGRYARPGDPPPPHVPPEARRPPWVETRPPAAATTAADPPPAPPEEPPAPPHPPPPPPPEPAPPEERELTVAEALEVLGVPPTADLDAIRTAYRERSRTCHPDKVAHLDEDFRALAHRKFRLLQRAYDLLTS